MILMIKMRPKSGSTHTSLMNSHKLYLSRKKQDPEKRMYVCGKVTRQVPARKAFLVLLYESTITYEEERTR